MPTRPGETRTFVLKTSPIDLLIPHNTTLWLSGEAKVATRLGLQLDLGYVFREGAVFNLSKTLPDLAFQSTDRNRLNFNVKTELRRYLGRDKGLNGFYGAGQVMFKQVNFNSNEAPAYDWREYTDLLDLDSYWMATRHGPENNYHIRRTELGLNAKFGYQHIFSHFALDLFLGLSARHIRSRQDLGEPSPSSSAYTYRGNGGWLPLPIVGGKLGYAF
ncbi:MAG: hypothetical protein M3Y12_06070 [Bacteroidota bacterium]|nr:hypothetical protein [Bacteroidota bacterium]